MNHKYNFDYTIKYALIGDMFIGKSNLITSFLGNSFIKIFKLKDKIIRLLINDTHVDLYYI